MESNMESKLKLMKFIYNLLNKFEALKNSVSLIEFYDFDLYLTFSSDFVKIKKFVDNCSIRKHMINPESCSCKIIKSNQFRYANLYYDFVSEKLIQNKLSTKTIINLNYSNFDNFVSSIINFNKAIHYPKVYFISSDFVIEKFKNNTVKLKVLDNYNVETVNIFLSVIDNKWLEYKNASNDMILLGVEKQLVDTNNIEKSRIFIVLYNSIKFYGSKWCCQNGYKSKNIIKSLYKAIDEEYKQAYQEGFIYIHYNYIPCPDLRCCLHYLYIIFEVTNIFELLLLTEAIDYIKYV